MLPKTERDDVSSRLVMRRIELTKRAVDGDALYTVRFSSGRSSVNALVRARLGHVGGGCGKDVK